MFRIVSATVVFGCSLLGVTASAEAQFGGVQRFLFRGMQYAGNHTYLSQPQNGPLYNYNSFSNRVEYNRAGQGYTYESYQFFGPDSFGNPNTLDLGPFKLQLGQDPTLFANGQPIGMHNKVGYTTAIIPEVTFQSQSGQRAYNQFSGVSNFAPAPLNYTMTLNTGVQDFSWTGNALINTQGSINALGFYDLQFRFTNVGQYTADGFLLHDEQVTDFDFGPINASGNIALDAIAALLQNNGSGAAAIPPRITSGAAAKDKQTEELLARLNAGETLSPEELQYITQQMFNAAFQADPLGVLTRGLPSQIPGFEGITLNMLASPQANPTVTPEPGTLAVLAMALGISAGLRTLHRRRRATMSLRLVG